MKKAQMETSMIRFIGELRKVANDLDNLKFQDEPNKVTFKQIIWDGIKIRLKGHSNMKWILKEMDSVDEFLEMPEVKEFRKTSILDQLI